jgi:methionine-rich copper-binding protein CopC
MPLNFVQRIAKSPAAAKGRSQIRLLAGHLVVLIISVLLINGNVQAQHSHGRRNTIEIEHQTVPEHDQVLEHAPEYLILRFSEYMRLVKLTVKVEDMEMIDIGFQFTPISNRVFTQMIPDLEGADYYTAEWAALNSENVMVYGYFCFSFGPDAKIPTSVINARVFPSNPF